MEEERGALMGGFHSSSSFLPASIVLAVRQTALYLGDDSLTD